MYIVFYTTKPKSKTLEQAKHRVNFLHCFMLFVSLHFCPSHHHSKTIDTLKKGGRILCLLQHPRDFSSLPCSETPWEQEAGSRLCAWFLDHCRCLANAKGELRAYIGHFNAVTHLLSVNKFTGTIVSVTHYGD